MELIRVFRDFMKKKSIIIKLGGMIFQVNRIKMMM
jgi:hypothetical protein